MSVAVDAVSGGAYTLGMTTAATATFVVTYEFDSGIKGRRTCFSCEEAVREVIALAAIGAKNGQAISTAITEQ